MKDGSGGWPADAHHCIRIGAMNDKRIVESAQDSFDVLVIQANLAASAGRGLSSWAGLDKPFWIDPIAYAFVAPATFLMSEQKVSGSTRKELRFKKTFETLSEAYGPPFSPLSRARLPLRPSDFNPTEDTATVHRVIEWQRNALSLPAEDEKYGLATTLEPVLFTIPYFPLTTVRDNSNQPEWLDVNMRLIAAAMSHYPPERLVGGLLIEDNLFDSEQELWNVVDTYVSVGLKHIWLWVSEIEEEYLTAPRALRLRRLAERLAASGARIHAAFAGGFSPLLLAGGLTSISHGVMYWEHKNWQPLAAGGLPTLRYYFPPLRQRLRFLDADVIVTDIVQDAADFHDNVCNCPTCQSTLEGDVGNFARFGEVEVRTRYDRRGRRRDYDVPLTVALARSKTHYLQSRGTEVSEATANGFDPVAALTSGMTYLSSSPSADLRHLRNWQAALQA